MQRKYPFTKQPGLKDCAAACTSMIIKYYHGFISMNKLSDMLKITRHGTTAYHIVETLKKLGFNAYGIKGTIKELSNHPKPFIANCLIENSYKHFVVVYEINNNYLIVADPAKKIQKMPKDEFIQIWTGISIHAYPVKPIVKMKDVSVKKFFKSLVISNIRYLSLIFCLSLLVTSLAIATSFFFQSIIDNIDKNLLKVCALFTILFLSKIIIDYYKNKVIISLDKKVSKKLTNEIFSKIINLPYSYYQGKTTGEIVSRLNDLNSVRSLLITLSLSLFVNIPLITITLLVLLYLNFTIFILVFIIFLFYLLIILMCKKKIKSLVFMENYERTSVNSYMTEAISGFETIKGLGIENKIISKFKGLLQKKIISTYKLDSFYNFIYFLRELVNGIFHILLILIGALLIEKEELSLGSLLTCLVLTSYFFTSVQSILNLDFEFKETVEALKRILDLTYYEAKSLPTKKIKGQIEIRDLTYSFDDVTNVLQDINLKIAKGEKILISGNSGSGKSTLLKIIKKFFPVEEKVFIDNMDISKIDINSINTSIVYIGPNEVLFTGSLLDNLTFRDGDYKKTMQLCKADEVIKNDVLGIYMLIEENGFNLSTGQKQRLALSRALQKFQVILIDEGFSGIDISMERIILKNLFKEFYDKTIIVVSHRLDNLDLFERLIKMHSGKIILDERKCQSDE